MNCDTSNAGEKLASADVERPCVSVSSKKITYGSAPPSRRRNAAFVARPPESNFFPGRSTTWVIADANESMNEFSIMLNFLANMAPAGVLCLSFGMIGNGYIPSVAVLLVFACIAGYAMYLIGRMCECTGKYTYVDLWSHVIGRRSAWIPALTIVLGCFWNCVASACIFSYLFASSIPHVMPALGVTVAMRIGWLIILGIFPILPLCMLKEFSLLTPTSVVAVVSVLYTLGVMALRSQDGSYRPGGAYFNKVPSATGSHLFTFTARFFIVGFLCHYNGCKYYREFQNKTTSRFGQSIAGSFALLSLMFGVAMISGYTTFGEASDTNILRNYAEDDHLANLARVSMGIANVCSFPLTFSGLREHSLALITFLGPSMEETCDFVRFQNTISIVMLTAIMVTTVFVMD